MLSAEDIPNPDKMKDNIYHGSVLPTMNKKLISKVHQHYGGGHHHHRVQIHLPHSPAHTVGLVCAAVLRCV